jgi:hypothetical protein
MQTDVTATFEAIVLQPLFEPLENEMGPIASTVFTSMLEKMLEQHNG